MSRWTTDLKEKITALWAQGLSASQIAAELGDGLTRNAVIGKVHRLGLPGRGNPSIPRERRAPSQPRAPRASRAAPPIASHARAEEKRAEAKVFAEQMIAEDASAPLTAGRSKGVTLLQLTDETCRFPLGDPQMPGFYFCGAKPIEGSPYCLCHTALAFQPPGERRRSA